jgi:hypothetical protein
MKQDKTYQGTDKAYTVDRPVFGNEEKAVEFPKGIHPSKIDPAYIPDATLATFIDMAERLNLLERAVSQLQDKVDDAKAAAANAELKASLASRSVTCGCCQRY